VSTLSLIFWGKKSQKAEKSGIKAEWEAEWATEKVDQLDTPVTQSVGLRQQYSHFSK